MGKASLLVICVVLALLPVALTFTRSKRSVNRAVEADKSRDRECEVRDVSQLGRDGKYYYDCKGYRPKTIHGYKTQKRSVCCPGYERDRQTKKCSRVKESTDLEVTIEATSAFKRYSGYMARAGVSTEIKRGGPYTVFVPTNTAMDRGVQADFSAESFYWRHTVAGRWETRDFGNAETFTSVGATHPNIVINRYSNGVVTANCARLLHTNHPSSNGYAHGIDRIMESLTGEKLVERLVGRTDVDYSWFIRTLAAAGLEDELKGLKEGYTLLLPTDAAVNKIDRAIANDLNKPENANRLREMLRGHIVPHRLCSAALIGTYEFETLAGTYVNITSDEGTLLLNGEAVFTTEVDYQGTDGVAHGISTVLLPDKSLSALEAIGRDERLTQFNKLARGAEVEETLSVSIGVTVIPFTDDAYGALPQEVKAKIESDIEYRKRVLGKHVIKRSVTSHDMMSGQMFETVGGENVDVVVTVEGPVLGTGKVVSKDWEVANGVVHVLDRVLTPIDDDASAVLRSSGQATLNDLLLKMFQGNATFTAFAPSDAAMRNLDDQILTSLSQDRTEAYKKLLEYHTVPHLLTSATFEKDLDYRLTTIRGDKVGNPRDRLTINRGEDGTIKVNNQARVVIPDVQYGSGVVHFIDTVLEPHSLQHLFQQARARQLYYYLYNRHYNYY